MFLFDPSCCCDSGDPCDVCDGNKAPTYFKLSVTGVTSTSTTSSGYCRWCECLNDDYVLTQGEGYGKTCLWYWCDGTYTGGNPPVVVPDQYCGANGGPSLLLLQEYGQYKAYVYFHGMTFVTSLGTSPIQCKTLDIALSSDSTGKIGMCDSSSIVLHLTAVTAKPANECYDPGLPCENCGRGTGDDDYGYPTTVEVTLSRFGTTATSVATACAFPELSGLDGTYLPNIDPITTGNRRLSWSHTFESPYRLWVPNNAWCGHFVVYGFTVELITTDEHPAARTVDMRFTLNATPWYGYWLECYLSSPWTTETVEDWPLACKSMDLTMSLGVCAGSFFGGAVRVRAV